jgi:hypothetical protein
MSDTPRTKAASRMAFSGEYMVEIEEAQKLERELADMTKQRDHYKAACDQYSEDEMLCKLHEATKQRDALADALPLAMARAYERGYQCGHEDTVESRFVIVHANDALDYFADDVRQMLLDGSQPEAQKALAATKGGSDE